jgi:hypothetical protein
MKNEELLKNLSFGSKTPIRTIEGKSFYLYKMTCKATGRIYVGTRVCKIFDPYKDRYVGCGIRKKKDGTLMVSFSNKKSPYFLDVMEKGIGNFNKEILAFFPSMESCLLAERIVVNEEFIEREDTYNKCVGGGLPPMYFGEKNGNFGNHWTQKQKDNLSKKKKDSGIHKGIKNPKAKSCDLYDFYEDKRYELSHIREIPEVIGRKLDYNWSSLMAYRYLLLNKNEDPYERVNKLGKPIIPVKILTAIKQGESYADIVKKFSIYGNYSGIISRIFKALNLEKI